MVQLSILRATQRDVKESAYHALRETQKLGTIPLMHIGIAIRVRRKAKGDTLEEVALAAGTDSGNLSRIERGKQGIGAALLKRIAAALRTTVATLYAEAEGTALQLKDPTSASGLAYPAERFDALEKAERENIEEAVELMIEQASKRAKRPGPKKRLTKAAGAKKGR